DVEPDEARLSAPRGDLLDHLASLALEDIAHHNLRTLPGEDHRLTLTHPAGPAGDEGHLSCQSHGLSSFLLGRSGRPPSPPRAARRAPPGARLDPPRRCVGLRAPPKPPALVAPRGPRGAPRYSAAMIGAPGAPQAPRARRAPGHPGRSSILRGGDWGSGRPPSPPRSSRPGAPGALLDTPRR